MKKLQNIKEKGLPGVATDTQHLADLPRKTYMAHRAKKSLGQNFLTNDHIAQAIVDSTNLTDKSSVLEIGPGKGVLTEKLLLVAGRVVAIEKDASLIPLLQERFALEIEEGRLVLVHDDILLCDLSSYNLKPSTFCLVANIPYYITGLLFRKFLEEGPQPSEMVLMIQKEVADRIMAKDKKESLLSISVKLYGVPSIIVKVGKGNFSPAPTIDSAVLKVSNISKDFFKALDEKQFFSFLRSGFAHKRKYLLGNLISAGIKSREELENAFQNLGIQKTIRPEDLTVDLWKALAQEILSN